MGKNVRNKVRSGVKNVRKKGELRGKNVEKGELRVIA
jgi:hypothetical protein